jgi:anti-sigma regulatory factor (Ser/Thr protein kinase)
MLLKDFSAKNFLGRDSEFELLKGIAAEARAGDASSIFLSGKRGVGKSEFMRHLYNYFFSQQNDAIPFYYSVRSAFISLENFSREYLGSFILQSLAFLKKDKSMLYSGVFSLEDLRRMATEMADPWAVNIIDTFFEIREGGDGVKLFSFAISTPYQSYARSGLPVVVMIDDFHKIRKFCGSASGVENRECWVLFENFLQSLHTPHIIAGFQADLQKMFFEETSVGEHLEIVNLPGLDRGNAIKLFTLLCEKYSLTFESELTDYLDMFSGNPFYIRSFMQAARQVRRPLSDDEFWDVYVNEVTRGKIYTYWTSILKAYIVRFDMRKPSLRLLQDLYEFSSDILLSDESERLSVNHEDLDTIINLLDSSGAVETGFSTLELAGDTILVDVIRGLYHREIKREMPDAIRDIIMENRRRKTMVKAVQSFDVIIPSAPKAELVAVKSLEHVARHYGIATGAVAGLQIALVELFVNILTGDTAEDGSHHLRFKRLEDAFCAEVETGRSETELKEADERSFAMIQRQVDDVQFEKSPKGTTIILVKKTDHETAAA